MQFELSETQQLVQATARQFAQQKLAPRAIERDIHSTFPVAELAQAAELGLLGVAVPEAYGGTGACAIAYALTMQELAAADAAVSVAIGVTNMVAELIAAVGTEAQKQAHVTKIVSGGYCVGAFALSEAHAGSDPASMKTTAVRQGDAWVINGTKQWITSGDRAGLFVVWAVTDPAAGARGISAFLVRGGTPGLSAGKPEDKMGLHGSTTVPLALDGVVVGDDALLGKLGDGFKLAMMALDGGRIGIAAQAVGIARAALRRATVYATERQQFGVPIIRHGAIIEMLADAATELEAAHWMVMLAASKKSAGQPFSKDAAMAKLFATESAGRICDVALQVHGGYGYTRDYEVERACRDVRVTRIYEGTSEIQRIVIARQLLAEASVV
ncbi:MAG: acyl-CoA dehydrogenase family protein [Myxococcales bacterium]|nr:acyl-CoA dehydrogenase family protein [Myxococcales bacterium]